MPPRSRSPLHYLPPADRALVQSFFADFAFAEFNLKSLGYIPKGGEDAAADCDAFAKSIAQPFAAQKAADFAKALATLTTGAPRKQVNRGGALGWKATPRPRGLSDAAWALILVRRVRNNLFHGAKFMVGGADPQVRRDRDLLSAASVVLAYAMDLAQPRKRGR